MTLCQSVNDVKANIPASLSTRARVLSHTSPSPEDQDSYICSAAYIVSSRNVDPVNESEIHMNPPKIRKHITELISGRLRLTNDWL